MHFLPSFYISQSLPPSFSLHLPYLPPSFSPRHLSLPHYVQEWGGRRTHPILPFLHPLPPSSLIKPPLFLPSNTLSALSFSSRRPLFPLLNSLLELPRLYLLYSSRLYFKLQGFTLLPLPGVHSLPRLLDKIVTAGRKNHFVCVWSLPCALFVPPRGSFFIVFPPCLLPFFHRWSKFSASEHVSQSTTLFIFPMWWCIWITCKSEFSLPYTSGRVSSDSCIIPTMTSLHNKLHT